MQRLKKFENTLCTQTHQHNSNLLKRLKLLASSVRIAIQAEKEQEILRFQNYTIRKLTSRYKKLAQERLTQQYVDQQPLGLGYWKQFPASRQEKEQFWRQLYGTFLDHTIQNQSGVVAIDTSKNDELVGVMISKDKTYFPEDLLKKMMSKDGLGKQIVVLQEQLFKGLQPKYQEMFQKKGLVLNIWGAAFLKQHMGKNLLPPMIKVICILGVRKGYQYAHVFASNIRSQIGVRKMGFVKITEYDTHKLQVDGKRPFAKVDSSNQFSALLIKKLQD